MAARRSTTSRTTWRTTPCSPSGSLPFKSSSILRMRLSVCVVLDCSVTAASEMRDGSSSALLGTLTQAPEHIHKIALHPRTVAVTPHGTCLRAQAGLAIQIRPKNQPPKLHAGYRTADDTLWLCASSISPALIMTMNGGKRQYPEPSYKYEMRVGGERDEPALSQFSTGRVG